MYKNKRSTNLFMLLNTPREFSFQLCLDFLKRSPKELLHQIREKGVVKALRIGDQVTVFAVTSQKNILQITFLSKEPNEAVKQLVTAYVREWFDLDTDLKPFYRMAK